MIKTKLTPETLMGLTSVNAAAFFYYAQGDLMLLALSITNAVATYLIYQQTQNKTKPPTITTRIPKPTPYIPNSFHKQQPTPTVEPHRQSIQNYRKQINDIKGELNNAKNKHRTKDRPHTFVNPVYGDLSCNNECNS